jgi:hypothetical protein
MGYVKENFRMAIKKLYEMYAFVLNTDVAMISSCKYHGQISCNADPQTGGLGSQMSLLLCPAFMTIRHTVAQLVEALRYKLEGCGFEYRWCHWNF